MNREVLLAGTAMFWLSNGGGEFSALNIFPQGVELFQKLGERRGLLGKQKSCSFPATARLVDKGAKSPVDTSQTPQGGRQALNTLQLLMQTEGTCLVVGFVLVLGGFLFDFL